MILGSFAARFSSHRVAFVGESIEEVRQEFGPLAAPEEDADAAPPPIGKHLSKVSEDEIQVLDAVNLKGFPEDEAQRRKA